MLTQTLESSRWLGSQTGDDLDALEKGLEMWPESLESGDIPEHITRRMRADLIWEARFKYEELILLQDDSICEWHFKMQFFSLYTHGEQKWRTFSYTIDSGKYKFCYWRERLKWVSSLDSEE